MWTKHSYQQFKRYIDYFTHELPVFEKIATMPPVVGHQKVLRLREELSECQDHKRILVHCGDCAEPFEHVNNDILTNKIDFYHRIQQMVESHHKPATLIGRIAGQYAKPRSSEFTTHNGTKIHNYKGDNVNGLYPEDRQPCEKKLLEGYLNSVITHNFISNNMDSLFTSHQGLILPYEAALTKEIQGFNYCLSAHMLWIGERTRQLDGAHLEFFRGIGNPVGIKVSSKITDEQFLHLVQRLNPKNEKGKLMIIVRMGHDHLYSKLKYLIDIKLKHNLNFLFVSDPMHGNTYQTKEKKIKTRHYDHIFKQINTFEEHMKKWGLPFGLSLESTHEDVTECIGGSFPLQEEHIDEEKYKSKCDPRLNPGQLEKLLRSVKF